MLTGSLLAGISHARCHGEASSWGLERYGSYAQPLDESLMPDKPARAVLCSPSNERFYRRRPRRAHGGGPLSRLLSLWFPWSPRRHAPAGLGLGPLGLHRRRHHEPAALLPEARRRKHLHRES